jgi:hypothetical protein
VLPAERTEISHAEAGPRSLRLALAISSSS